MESSVKRTILLQEQSNRLIKAQPPNSPVPDLNELKVQAAKPIQPHWSCFILFHRSATAGEWGYFVF